MVKIRDQNPYEIDLPFDVKEGNYTVTEVEPMSVISHLQFIKEISLN